MCPACSRTGRQEQLWLTEWERRRQRGKKGSQQGGPCRLLSGLGLLLWVVWEAIAEFLTEERLICSEEDWLGCHVEIDHSRPRVEAGRPIRKPCAAIQERSDGGKGKWLDYEQRRSFTHQPLRPCPSPSNHPAIHLSIHPSIHPPNNYLLKAYFV